MALNDLAVSLALPVSLLLAVVAIIRYIALNDLEVDGFCRRCSELFDDRTDVP